MVWAWRFMAAPPPAETALVQAICSCTLGLEAPAGCCSALLCAVLCCAALCCQTKLPCSTATPQRTGPQRPLLPGTTMNTVLASAGQLGSLPAGRAAGCGRTWQRLPSSILALPRAAAAAAGRRKAGKLLPGQQVLKKEVPQKARCLCGRKRLLPCGCGVSLTDKPVARKVNLDQGAGQHPGLADAAGQRVVRQVQPASAACM